MQEWLPGGGGPEHSGRRPAFQGLSQQGLSPARPCFWSKLRVPDVGQEDSSWGLSLPSPPNLALSGNKEAGAGAQCCLGAASICPLLRSPQRRRLLVPVTQTQLPKSLSWCLP